MGIPIISAGLQFLGGLGQTLFSGVKKANKNLENQVNSYQKNDSIMDYYNKSLNQYSANAYDSQGYQNDTNKIQRNLASGIGATQDRRGGLASIAGLVQGANDADANAAQRAEGVQRQNLHMLGNATRMKAAEDFKPFEMKYNLLAAKAGAAAKTKSQGLQNMFGGLSSAATMGLGGNKGTKGSSSNNNNYVPSWQVSDDNTYP